MAHNILITGGSGYLGGSLLAALEDAKLPPYNKLYALVRTDEQAKGVRQYGAEALHFDPGDESAVHETIQSNRISIVFFLIDALNSTYQVHFIKALGALKKSTGKDVHFLHTTGAKMFSSHTGAPTDRLLPDNEPQIYGIHRAQKPPKLAWLKSPDGHSELSMLTIPARTVQSIQTNIIVTDLSAAQGVKSYVFAPCIVYGRGKGFGNKISVQTVAIVKAARSARRVYSVDDGEPSWPVCHVDDNTGLYIAILCAILDGKGEPPNGKNGFYLASPGRVKWMDLYRAMAKELVARGVVDTAEVGMADEQALKSMSQGLRGDVDMVPFQVGGECTFTARNGRLAGWTPLYEPQHILDTVKDEAQLILENLE